MKIDVTAPLTDLVGKTLADYPTVGSALIAVLMAAAEAGKPYTGAQQIERYQLSLEIRKTVDAQDADHREVNLKAEQVVMLKADLARLFSPIVAGQVLPLLDD